MFRPGAALANPSRISDSGSGLRSRGGVFGGVLNVPRDFTYLKWALYGNLKADAWIDLPFATYPDRCQILRRTAIYPRRPISESRTC